MAKEQKASVKVQLLCIMSGGEITHSPGDVIEVDAEEASRLIDLGAAKAPATEATKEA